MPPEDLDYQRLPEENPGGFQWGNQNANQNQEDARPADENNQDQDNVNR